MKFQVVSAMMSAMAIIAGIRAEGIRNPRDIAINVNGQPVFTHVTAPQLVQGRVLVPIRGVLEKLGVTVEWHPEERMVVAMKDGRTITLGIGAEYGRIDDAFVTLDVPARIINGRTMVPLRYLAEAADAYVMWDASRSTVVITTRLHEEDREAHAQVRVVP
ncbi:MAG: copper amine oxidase N-terminal domain-containing protein [Fimbriimonas sp.]